MLENSNSIKFLSRINPQKINELKIEMEITADENSIYAVDTTFSSREEIQLKFRGEFKNYTDD